MRAPHSLFDELRNRKKLTAEMQTSIDVAMQAAVSNWIKRNTELSISVGEFAILWESLDKQKLERMSLFELGRTIQFRAIVGWSNWLSSEHLDSVRAMLRPFSLYHPKAASRKGAA